MTVVTVPVSLVTYQHRQDIHHHDALMHEVSRMLLRSTIKTILRNVLFFPRGGPTVTAVSDPFLEKYFFRMGDTINYLLLEIVFPYAGHELMNSRK